MALFARIVEKGSLSAAGRALGLSKATVSRQLAELEARLGTPLLTRSTRALSLTDSGRHLFDRVQPIVQEAQRAHTELVERQAVPSGLLRVSVSEAYGQTVIAPRLVRLLDVYPAVRIDLTLSDERVTLVAGGFDLAICMGEIEDSDWLRRTLTDMPLVIVAARPVSTHTARRAQSTICAAIPPS